MAIGDGIGKMGATRLRNALPLMGLVVAVVVDAAWIGFLGYELFKLL
jgi:hypothetical protein